MIYILLPVHNRVAMTLRVIDCLEAQTRHDWHLVLIDDGSTDGTADLAQKRLPGLSLIKGHGHWWWAGSLQQGLRWLHANPDVAEDDTLLILNNDTTFGPDFLHTAIEILTSHPGSLLLARCHSEQTGRLLDAGVKADWRRLTFDQAGQPEEINCLSTRGLFLRTGSLGRIGGFHPILLPHYASDYEFTLRAGRRGFQLMTHPDLTLKVNEETSGLSDSDLRGLAPAGFVRHLFSLRSTRNPLIWSSFILLACPWPWKPVNLARVWFQAVNLIIGRVCKGPDFQRGRG